MKVDAKVRVAPSREGRFGVVQGAEQLTAMIEAGWEIIATTTIKVGDESSWDFYVLEKPAIEGLKLV